MMQKRIVQLMALWIAELMILFPFAIAKLEISYSANPVVTHNSAEISWTTNENATARVYYSLAAELLNLFAENLSLGKTHKVVISNLQNSTTYYYELVSTNTSGYSVTKRNGANPYSFKTAVPPDKTPPAFAENVTLSLPKDTEARITWKSDESATSLVYFGQSSSLGSVITDNNFVTDHVVSLNVVKDTIYYYRVGMCDKQNNCANTSANSFIAGADMTPPTIEANVPNYYNDRFLTIAGTTKPITEIDVFVNNQLNKWTKSDSKGNFKVTGIDLSTSATNNLRIEAKDSAGNLATKQFQVTVDTSPPILTLKNVTTQAKSQTMQVQGSVNELCTITFQVSSTKDLEPPQKVTGLTNGSIATNTIRLSWNKNTEQDLLNYAVYRNGARITTTKDTMFVDTGAMVDSGKTYRYRVSAVDQSCNEGPLSDEFAISTLPGGQAYNQTPSAVNLSCKKHYFTKTINLSGDFSESVSLKEGVNNLQVIAKDRAGNSAAFAETVLLDTQPPKILEDNLGVLSPSYISDVTIKGKVSEKATIRVYVNNDTDATQTKTDDKGNFNVDVHLRRDFRVNYLSTVQQGLPVQSAEYQYPDAWRNDVRIVAIDDVGLKDEKKSSIILTECGYGSAWKVDLSKAMPDMLTPRLMIEGMDMIGVAANISWQGGWDNGTLRDVTLRPRPLSQEQERKWDKSWIITDIVKSPDKKQAYIMIKVLPQDPSKGKNWTMLKKEQNLSDHRLGECGVPGFGCLKVPLMLVIDYETKQYNFSQQQRHCFDVMVTIDRRIPSDKIPEAFLKASITLLNSTIEIIDTVLKPLNTIKEYVFYACAATWVIDFYYWFQESYTCQYASVVSTISSVATGKVERFDKAVAQIGKCDKVYLKEGENAKQALNQQCNSCADMITKRMDFEKNMHWVCDRIFCPSVPSLEKYIRMRQQDNPIRQIKGTTYYQGSSCAAVATTTLPGSIPGVNEYPIADSRGVTAKYRFVDGEVQVYDVGIPGTEPGRGWMPALAGKYQSEDDLKKAAANSLATTTRSSGGKFQLTYAKAKEVYSNYLKYKDVAKTDTGIYCNGLHQPSAECCGSEYLAEWNQACVVMDVLKENVCLQAEGEAKITELANDPQNPINCHVTWNRIAGFCAPDGQVQFETVNTGLRYRNSQEPVSTTTGGQTVNVYVDRQISNDCLWETINSADSYGGEIIYAVVPPGQGTGNADYRVYRGYITKSLTPIGSAQVLREKKDLPMQADITFSKGRGADGDIADVTNYFFLPGKEQGPYKKTYTTCNADTEGCKKFMDDMVRCTSGAGDSKSPGTVGVSDGRALEIYNRIQEKIGHKEKEYVVDPTSGLLRSIQCVCLSAITGYLTLYKNMMTAVKNCFQTILITGDGSSGMCRAVLSVYICDLIYDLIKCVMEKYGGSYYREGGGTIGNFFGSLTAAGEGVNRAVQQRYGATQLWSSMFADRKLVHSICLFAFTGTWDVDVSNLLNQQFTVPIKSEGFLYPCERRFMSFNPTTNPSGLTTWNYHFGAGLVAGAELNNIRLKMVCSDGFNCNPAEGFENGRCDCQGKPEEQTVEGIPNTLKPGQMIFEQGDIYTLKKDLKVRFDKAVLEWTYIDNNKKTITEKAECKISQKGGSPPAICKFDLGGGVYRCSVSMGSEWWAKFNNKPTPEYGYNQDAFRVGNVMQFNVDIQQQIPSNSDCAGQTNCQYTKYLKIVVKNQNGRVIYDSNYMPLNINGRFSELVRLAAIKTEDLTATAFNVPVVQAVIGSSKDFVPDSGEAETIPGQFDPNKMPFYIELDRKNNQYRICSNSQCNPEIWKDKYSSQEVVYAGVRVKFTPSAPSDAKGNKIDTGMYIVKYNAGLPVTINCETGTVKQTWNAVFQIYDAADIGGAYNPATQISVYNSQKQEQPVSFSVQCGEGANRQKCVDPMTAPSTSACFCEQQQSATATPDCAAGRYCVDGKCIDQRGCDKTGKVKATDWCICDGYAYSENQGSVEMACAPGQYCYGKTCLNSPVSGAGATGTTPEIVGIVLYYDSVSNPISASNNIVETSLTRGKSYDILIKVREDKALKYLKVDQQFMQIIGPDVTDPQEYNIFTGQKFVYTPSSQDKEEFTIVAEDTDSNVAQGKLIINNLNNVNE